jgi:hypothetical protein
VDLRYHPPTIQIKKKRFKYFVSPAVYASLERIGINSVIYIGENENETLGLQDELQKNLS